MQSRLPYLKSTSILKDCPLIFKISLQEVPLQQPPLVYPLPRRVEETACSELHFPESAPRPVPGSAGEGVGGDTRFVLSPPALLLGPAPCSLEGAVLPFGPQGSSWSERTAVLCGRPCRRAMTASDAGPSVREIFSTLEYGPAPESHACALVRACGAVAPPPFPVLAALVQARTPVILRRSSATPPL